MSTDPDVPHTSSAGLIEHVATPIDADSAAETLKHGARGAFVVAGIAVDCSSSAGSPFISFCSYTRLGWLRLKQIRCGGRSQMASFQRARSLAPRTAGSLSCWECSGL